MCAPRSGRDWWRLGLAIAPLCVAFAVCGAAPRRFRDQFDELWARRTGARRRAEPRESISTDACVTSTPPLYGTEKSKTPKGSLNTLVSGVDSLPACVSIKNQSMTHVACQDASHPVRPRAPPRGAAAGPRDARRRRARPAPARADICCVVCADRRAGLLYLARQY